MAKWVRALSRTAGESAQWHLLDSDKDFVVANTLCGERLPAALEVASTDDKTERDGRCRGCETRSTAMREERSAEITR